MTFLFTLAVALCLFSFLGSFQARANRRAVLRRIEDRVSGRLVPGNPLFHDELTGEIHGRPIRLRISTRPVPLPTRTGYPLTVTLELRHAPEIRLRVRRDAGLAAVEKALGLVKDVDVSGGDRFDRRYLVEVDGDSASTPLADEGVRQSVNAIIARWGLEDVRIEAGQLVVHGDSRWLGQAMLHELLYELDVLAHAYDREPAPQIGVTARFFWVGGADAAPRCPYCHDGLAEEDELTACAVCNTLLHGECMEENRGCPILGCGGRGGVPTGPLRLKE